MIVPLSGYKVNAFEVHLSSNLFSSQSLCRSSRPEVFLGRDVLKICSKIMFWKHFFLFTPSPNNTFLITASAVWTSVILWIIILAILCKHCVKSVCIRSYSGPHFPTFGMNTERNGVSLRIQSECGKMRTRMTSNMDIFYAVKTAYSNKYQIFTFNKNKLVIKTFSRNTIE